MANFDTREGFMEAMGELESRLETAFRDSGREPTSPLIAQDLLGEVAGFLYDGAEFSDESKPVLRHIAVGDVTDNARLLGISEPGNYEFKFDAGALANRIHQGIEGLAFTHGLAPGAKQFYETPIPGESLRIMVQAAAVLNDENMKRFVDFGAGRISGSNVTGDPEDTDHFPDRLSNDYFTITDRTNSAAKVRQKVLFSLLGTQNETSGDPSVGSYRKIVEDEAAETAPPVGLGLPPADPVRIGFDAVRAGAIGGLPPGVVISTPVEPAAEAADYVAPEPAAAVVDPITPAADSLPADIPPEHAKYAGAAVPPAEADDELGGARSDLLRVLAARASGQQAPTDATSTGSSLPSKLDPDSPKYDARLANPIGVWDKFRRNLYDRMNKSGNSADQEERSEGRFGGLGSTLSKLNPTRLRDWYKGLDDDTQSRYKRNGAIGGVALLVLGGVALAYSLSDSDEELPPREDPAGQISGVTGSSPSDDPVAPAPAPVAPADPVLPTPLPSPAPVAPGNPGYVPPSPVPAPVAPADPVSPTPAPAPVAPVNPGYVPPSPAPAPVAPVNPGYVPPSPAPAPVAPVVDNTVYGQMNRATTPEAALDLLHAQASAAGGNISVTMPRGAVRAYNKSQDYGAACETLGTLAAQRIGGSAVSLTDAKRFGGLLTDLCDTPGIKSRLSSTFGDENKELGYRFRGVDLTTEDLNATLDRL